jgi:hypothetical protein
MRCSATTSTSGLDELQEVGIDRLGVRRRHEHLDLRNHRRSSHRPTPSPHDHSDARAKQGNSCYRDYGLPGHESRTQVRVVEGLVTPCWRSFDREVEVCGAGRVHLLQGRPASQGETVALASLRWSNRQTYSLRWDSPVMGYLPIKAAAGSAVRLCTSAQLLSCSPACSASSAPPRRSSRSPL